MSRWLPIALALALPLLDLAWNLTHLNIGLVDFYGLTLPALGIVQNGAWPATPYFPAGYPLLLIPFGLLGSTLVGGYVLSAVGAMLALTGVRKLALELGAPAEWTAAAIALAWAEPTFRVTAGSPSVDMLYTGVGVWTLIIVTRLWTRKEGLTVRNGGPLVILFVLADLLRYHALVLVIPIVAVLLFARPQTRLFLSGFLLFFMLMTLEVWLGAGLQEPPAGTFGLQVRVGLEAEQSTKYASTEALFADYATFATHARSSSVIADYGLPRIAAHTAKQWLMFLRRPPVALALLLWIAALALRRLTPGIAPLALWILGYALALSVAYYTPRAALLPVLVGVALVFALVPRLLPKRTDYALAAACTLLLLAYWPAGKFARADMAERTKYARISVQTAEAIKQHDIDPDSFITSDMRVMRLPELGNPWQKPFKSLSQTWLDDPAIKKEQLPGYR